MCCPICGLPPEPSSDLLKMIDQALRTLCSAIAGQPVPELRYCPGHLSAMPGAALHGPYVGFAKQTCSGVVPPAPGSLIEQLLRGASPDRQPVPEAFYRAFDEEKQGDG